MTVTIKRKEPNARGLAQEARAAARAPRQPRRELDEILQEKELDGFRAKQYADQVERNTAKVKHGRQPPGLTSTTTPAGIAANDPDAIAEAWQESPDGQILALPVDQLERHPINRRPKEADVLKMTASILDRGQLEPCVVWIPDERKPDRYQLISGETRWLAIKRIGRPTAQCRIVTGITAAEALELLARYNGERTDLDPIQKARLINELCTAVGDTPGKTRQQAAEIVGLESGGAAANLVRLLELPPAWQQRVADGELAWTWAREILPILPLAPVMRELEKHWKQREQKNRPSYERNAFDSRHALAHTIEHSLGSDCRRLDEKQWIGYSLKTLPIDASKPEVRAELGIVDVELPSGKQGQTQTVHVATNVKAYKALVSAEQARAESKRIERETRDRKPKDRKQTPAELRAAGKQKADQLGARVAAWRHDWLKALIVRELDEHPALRERLLIAVALDEINLTWGEFKRLPEAVDDVTKAAGASGGDTYARLVALGHNVATLRDAGAALVKAAIGCPDRDGKWPHIPHKMLDEIAATAGIDLALEWNALQEAWRADGEAAGDGQREESRFERFFELYQTDQLDALGKELDVYLGRASGKAAKIKLLLGRDRNLPLPKAIKPLAGERAKPKKRKAR